MPRFLSYPVVTPVAAFPHSGASSIGEGSGMFQSLQRRPRNSASSEPRAPRGAGPIAPTGRKRGKLDVWLLGLTIVLGGQFFSWNAGLSAGLAGFGLAYALVGVAYVLLCCCTAEISGMLPFAGGAYGLARCTLGFTAGFLLGCCEALEYIAYVATTTLLLADMIVAAAPSARGLEPLIWLSFYASALALHLRGGRVFWAANFLLGAVSLLVVIVFCVGALAFLDLDGLRRDPHVGFVGGASEVLRVLPLAAWFFVGVEALSMANDDVHAPRTTVPQAQVTCVLTLAVTGAAVLFVASAVPHAGGLQELAETLAPLNAGFHAMFELPPASATLLSIPATYATAYGFMWCYGKLIRAMALSRLLPSWLARTSRRGKAPVAALLAGAVVSYALCVLVYVVPHLAKHLFSVCILSAFVAYSGQCVGYIVLRRNYRLLAKSQYRNPFGYAGAVVSLVIWLLGIVAVAGFQGNGGVEALAFLAVVAALALFYHGYAKKRQTFSPQENAVLIVAHVAKFTVSRPTGRRSSASSGASTTRRSWHRRAQGGVRRVARVQPRASQSLATSQPRSQNDDSDLSKVATTLHPTSQW
ncbi:hypothetical protein ATCC90586_004645 [Pythium insidiosum]|nr:hypothetical protein ATCC90586_004645 [Pythium insidiosum]